MRAPVLFLPAGAEVPVRRIHAADSTCCCMGYGACWRWVGSGPEPPALRRSARPCLVSCARCSASHGKTGTEGIYRVAFCSGSGKGFYFSTRKADARELRGELQQHSRKSVVHGVQQWVLNAQEGKSTVPRLSRALSRPSCGFVAAGGAWLGLGGVGLQLLPGGCGAVRRSVHATLRACCAARCCAGRHMCGCGCKGAWGPRS